MATIPQFRRLARIDCFLVLLSWPNIRSIGYFDSALTDRQERLIWLKNLRLIDSLQKLPNAPLDFCEFAVVATVAAIFCYWIDCLCQWSNDADCCPTQATPTLFSLASTCQNHFPTIVKTTRHNIRIAGFFPLHHNHSQQAVRCFHACTTAYRDDPETGNVNSLTVNSDFIILDA